MVSYAIHDSKYYCFMTIFRPIGNPDKTDGIKIRIVLKYYAIVPEIVMCLSVLEGLTLIKSSPYFSSVMTISIINYMYFNRHARIYIYIYIYISA